MNQFYKIFRLYHPSSEVPFSGYDAKVLPQGKIARGLSVFKVRVAFSDK